MSLCIKHLMTRHCIPLALDEYVNLGIYPDIRTLILLRRLAHCYIFTCSYDSSRLTWKLEGKNNYKDIVHQYTVITFSLAFVEGRTLWSFIYKYPRKGPSMLKPHMHFFKACYIITCIHACQDTFFKQSNLKPCKCRLHLITSVCEQLLGNIIAFYI